MTGIPNPISQGAGSNAPSLAYVRAPRGNGRTFFGESPIGPTFGASTDDGAGSPATCTAPPLPETPPRALQKRWYNFFARV